MQNKKGEYRNCPICGKQIYVYRYLFDKDNCCSRSCSAILRYKKGEKFGFQKENKINIEKIRSEESKINYSKSKQKDKNSQWKGGISQDFYRQFLKDKCEKCNSIATTIHHRDRDRKNNSEENLQSLCRSCHLNIHKPNQKKKIIVALSAGQDSTTTLQWAIKNFDEVEAISIFYNQKHKIELEQAKKIAKITKIKHTIVSLQELFSISDSALIRKDKKIIEKKGELPTSFVPGRNIAIILAIAIYAYKKDIHHIALGVSQTDFSGYPDCRNDVIKQTEELIRSSFEYDFYIHTPLMFLTKAQEVLLMKELGGFDLLKYTHTCYEGKRPACGKCPACKLRLKGFQEANLSDPLQYE